MIPELPDDAVTDEDDFDRLLAATLLAALRRDVDPRGSWVHHTDGDGPNFEVLISELAESGSAE